MFYPPHEPQIPDFVGNQIPAEQFDRLSVAVDDVTRLAMENEAYAIEEILLEHIPGEMLPQQSGPVLIGMDPETGESLFREQYEHEAYESNFVLWPPDIVGNYHTGIGDGITAALRCYAKKLLTAANAIEADGQADGEA